MKNKDLEEQLKNSNAIVTGFNTVKGELDSKIENLNKTVMELNNDIKEKVKIIQDKNKEITNSSKTIDNIEKDVEINVNNIVKKNEEEPGKNLCQ